MPFQVSLIREPKMKIHFPERTYTMFTEPLPYFIQFYLIQDTDVDISFLKTHTIPRISGDPASVAGTVVFSKVFFLNNTTGSIFICPINKVLLRFLFEYSTRPFLS